MIVEWKRNTLVGQKRKIPRQVASFSMFIRLLLLCYAWLQADDHLLLSRVTIEYHMYAAFMLNEDACFFSPPRRHTYALRTKFRTPSLFFIYFSHIFPLGCNVESIDL